MKICGLQKLTLLDYPEKIACTVFLYGCNFRCPFCHNAALVTEKPVETLSQKELFDFLDKRTNILDGVCVTGGEPLMNDDVDELLRGIKERGFLVKVDTNGSFPDRLKRIVDNGLVDYVAMDVKNSFDKYETSAGIAPIKEIEESIAFLLEGKVDYEFRTTVYGGAFTPSDMEEIGKTIRGAKRYFLQNFVDSGNLIGKAERVDESYLRTLLNIVKEYVPAAEIRGI